MSDEVDQANDRVELDTSLAIALVRLQEMPKGEPGECDLCGEFSERLVGGACAPCRDKWGRP